MHHETSLYGMLIYTLYFLLKQSSSTFVECTAAILAQVMQSSLKKGDAVSRPWIICKCILPFTHKEASEDSLMARWFMKL